MSDQPRSADPVELAELYVSGAVSDEERDFFESRLVEGDQPYVAELKRLRNVAEHLLEAVEPVAPPGSVMVISVHPGVTTANWGGMMSTRARAIGLEGVVLDGRARDIEEHREMGFFVFARGVSVHGSGGYTRVASVGAPVSCGGMTVCEGDIILGDLNGVVVIPQGRIEEVLAKTEEMAALDEKMTSALEGGASIADTFAKYRG